MLPLFDIARTLGAVDVEQSTKEQWEAFVTLTVLLRIASASSILPVNSPTSTNN